MKFRYGDYILASAEKNDISELSELFCELETADGHGRADYFSSIETFVSNDFLTDGPAENYELLTLRVCEMLVGVILIYRDYPAKSFIEFKSIYVGRLARRKGCGTTAVKMLCHYFRDSGYKSARVRFLLNQSELFRFWHCLDFNTILSISTDREASDGAEHEYITLERHFQPPRQY